MEADEQMDEWKSVGQEKVAVYAAAYLRFK
jgi:hypothetical protein